MIPSKVRKRKELGWVDVDGDDEGELGQGGGRVGEYGGEVLRRRSTLQSATERRASSFCRSVTWAVILEHFVPTFTIALPLTSEFNSARYLTTSSALGWPKLSLSRKKLLPRSAPVTLLGSRIVNCPIPVKS